MATPFHPGQRWISESEPELGLGSVLHVSAGTVTLTFPASGERREYARDNAPLRRVRFRGGDTIRSADDKSLVVESVSERKGLLIYHCSGRVDLPETSLHSAITFNKPEERLLAGHVDDPGLFDLRLAALRQQHRRARSTVRGFVGGRIDLIPHQLFIASEVAARPLPRVLLADEVGLGKTIEACLILHRLILTGRAQRVLILVPESLVHQWFVELLRRFNLWFHIFDEERCDAIETANPGSNPFLDDQLVLASIDLLTRTEHRAAQALAAGWDLVVVDEAHHLGWSPEAPSTAYSVVEKLAANAPGLLLLTATPEQLGMRSHFARLRLLDPDRFHDFDAFLRETEQYLALARLADQLLTGKELSVTDRALLGTILHQTPDPVSETLSKASKSGSSDREGLINALLDRHGTGRVMFRNTRAVVTGFPKRIPLLSPLTAASEDSFEALADEFAADTTSGATDFEPDFTSDPRIVWLANLLRGLGEEKVLLICRTQRKVEAIDAALRQQINIKAALFHEGLPLVQRDRNAAWFAEEDGARILICSEIGSEGRNFQFAHHLVLFDLPLDPELLEQRIGRLDRIGQTCDIQIHIPYVTTSPQEVLARWHHEGLNAFARNMQGGRALLDEFGGQLHDVAQDYHETKQSSEADVNRVIRATAKARESLAAKLEQGRDRLLELNSYRPERARQLADQIRAEDADTGLDEFMLAVFDHYSIHLEELAPRTYHLGSAGVFADTFPGLPAEGLTITAERSRALAREDVQFLTWDHPLVTGALDMLLGAEQGNSSLAHWPAISAPGLYLEAIYVLECVAPRHLHIERFLPPTPLRVLVDHRGGDISAKVPAEKLARELKRPRSSALIDRPEIREELLPDLIAASAAAVNKQVPALVREANKVMAAQLDGEITRLVELQKVNPSVRPEEIELLKQQRAEIAQHLASARPRLDAIRLIQSGSVG